METNKQNSKNWFYFFYYLLFNLSLNIKMEENRKDIADKLTLGILKTLGIVVYYYY